MREWSARRASGLTDGVVVGGRREGGGGVGGCRGEGGDERLEAVRFLITRPSDDGVTFSPGPDRSQLLPSPSTQPEEQQLVKGH